MKLEAISRRIHYVHPDGTEVTLLPGCPVEMPTPAARDLLKKAQAHVRLASPIRIGWLIGYRDRGALRGGSDDRDAGEVVDTRFDGVEWKFITKSGCLVKASQVKGVTKTDAHGTPVSCWTTREHGLDGEKSRLPFLHELPREHRQQIQEAFYISAETLDALSTGNWSADLWDDFWKGQP